MWEFLLRQLMKQAGRGLAGTLFNDEANGPEAYADRIKRDFHLEDYADAWKRYASDPDYWHNYYGYQPRPDAKTEIMHDSVAAAGIPSRYNVWEYDYPGSSVSAPAGSSNEALIGDPRVRIAPPPVTAGPASAFLTGVPAVPYLSPAGRSAPGGLPGMIAAAMGKDQPDSTQFQPLAGGLLGMIQDYMRDNPTDGGRR